MSITSKFISLKEYIPAGNPELSHFSLYASEINLENSNDVLVKNEWISVDPYMRARMTERKNYLPPFELNKPMLGAAIGKVQKSNSKKFFEGNVVLSENGWRDYFVEKDTKLQKIENNDLPIQTYLGPLGMTGHTAYIGLFKIGDLKEKQTVFGIICRWICRINGLSNCKKFRLQCHSKHWQ